MKNIINFDLLTLKMLAKGYTISSLEVAAGIANGVIGKWRTSSPNLLSFVKVCDVLECTVDELIDRDELNNKSFNQLLTLLEKKSKELGKQFTISDLCKEVGINQSVFSNWKKRGGSLSAINLAKVSNFFGVPMEFFMKE